MEEILNRRIIFYENGFVKNLRHGGAPRDFHGEPIFLNFSGSCYNPFFHKNNTIAGVLAESIFLEIPPHEYGIVADKDRQVFHVIPERDTFRVQLGLPFLKAQTRASGSGIDKGEKGCRFFAWLDTQPCL